MKNWSFRRKLIAFSLSMLLFTCLFIGVHSYFSAKAELDTKGEIILKNAVNMAILLVQSMNVQVIEEKITLEEAQKRVIDLLSTNTSNQMNSVGVDGIDLGNSGYFIIMKDNGLVLMHPELMGQNTWLLQDKSKKRFYFVQDQIKKAKEGGGYTYFDWKYINSDKIDEKVTYSKWEPTWGWVIEASSYKSDYNKGAANIMKSVAIIFAILTVISIICIYFFMRSSVKPITQVIEAMNKSVSGEYVLIPEIECRDERGVLISGFNQMSIAVKESLAEQKKIESYMVDLNKNLENRVIERTIELNKAKELAIQNSHYKSDFLANMSHEIRTPINAIMSVIYLLDQTSLSDKQKEYNDIAKLSTKNLQNIINNILDFSKIEANMVEIESTNFSMCEFVQDIMKVMSIRTKEKGLEIIVKVDENIPPILNGDINKVYHVLTNIIGNAIKFTDSGQVSCDVNLKLIDTDCVHIRFNVSDTGIGMKAEQIERIFTPFSQADSSITRKYGGTGLGLSISKQLVSLMGGTISVKSVEGKGSTFTVDLCFKYATDISVDSIHKLSEPFSDANRATFKQLRILLVEDNEINQLVTKEVLQLGGMIVDFAENGQVAIDLLRQGNAYDVILMDLHMPIMGGYEATEKIREFNQTIPIIALTADAVKGIKYEVIAKGMNDFVVKPIEPTQLFAAIEKVTSKGILPMNDNDLMSKENTCVSELERYPGIQTKEGLLRVNGNRQVYLQILKMFLDKQQYCGLEIENALSEGDVETAIRLAHTLKGVSGSIGANEVQTLANELEKQIKDHSEKDELVASLNVIKSQLQKLCQTIGRYMEDAKNEYIPEQPSVVNWKERDRIIRDLYKKVKTKDFDAVSYFSNHKSVLMMNETNLITKELEEAISNFQWDLAERILEEKLHKQEIEE